MADDHERGLLLMTTHTVDLAHHSGRYDNMHVSAGFKTLLPHCSVMAHTEFGNDKRATALKTAATKAGWGFHQHNRSPYDECCYTWDTKVWKHLDDDAKIISDVAWFSAATGHQMPKFTALAVHLEHLVDQSRWTFVTCHTPSHVATWDGWRRPHNRIRCYQDGIANLGRWVLALDKKWPQHATVVSADWNAPCEQKWFRGFLEKNFPAPYAVAAPNRTGEPYPNTHDSRCIDWAVLGANVAKTGNARAITVPDSDHKSMLLPLHLKKEPA